MMPKLLAIIPCYNEEASIKATVDSLENSGINADYIIVNDGSLDNTKAICLDNSFPVIDIPFNLGLTNAVQTGMRYAYLNGYDIALQFDGDGQHLPGYIPEMVKQMQMNIADIVIGSRYMHEPPKGLRGLGGRVISAAIKFSSGIRLSDPTSGMRLFNRKMIERFANQMNYAPEPDTIAYLINQGVKVVETPVVMQERKSGESYLSAINALAYMLRMFVSIVIVQWFRSKEV